MITRESNRRRTARRVWVALALTGALVACDNTRERQQQATFDLERVPEHDRGFNQTELDSLRAMKITHRVVRDEYWDMKGGVIANDRVEVWYSSRKIYVLQAMAVLKQMDMVADQIKQSFGTLPAEKLVIVCAPNMETFQEKTGRDWWHYGHLEGDTLNFQTPMTLFMRGLLTVAARREYGMWALAKLTHDKAPSWMVAGMALHLAGERDVLRGQRKEYAAKPVRMEMSEIDEHLTKQADRLEMRRALYNAYLMTNQLVETHGMPAVAAFMLACSEEPDANAAAQRVFSQPYDAVLAEAQAWKEPALP